MFEANLYQKIHPRFHDSTRNSSRSIFPKLSRFPVVGAVAEILDVDAGHHRLGLPARAPLPDRSELGSDPPEVRSVPVHVGDRPVHVPVAFDGSGDANAWSELLKTSSVIEI